MTLRTFAKLPKTLTSSLPTSLRVLYNIRIPCKMPLHTETRARACAEWENEAANGK